jgi:hypothetical protein
LADPKDVADVEATARGQLVTVLLGGAAIVGVVFTGRTYQLSRQGQITDRYTKAIGQLGDDKLEIRLGGIYALERIAVDSERDHSTIVEVLSAYIRERRPYPPVPADEPLPEPIPTVGTDVKAALTVLGRLPRRDLVRAHLHRADLPLIDLPHADLTAADLSSAHLPGAMLNGADLTKADLFAATLTSADLSDARLVEARLTGARLVGARLEFADLTGADLVGVNLAGAALRGARLIGANLAGARLPNADLTGVDLSGARLAGVEGTRTRCYPPTPTRQSTGTRSGHRGKPAGHGVPQGTPARATELEVVAASDTMST